jgi:transcriptional regulator with XRE-family HTH domain
MKDLASRVKAAREKLGWSCAEVDRKAELSVGHTARIEAGGTNVTYETLTKLAKALGVTVGWLVKS